AVVTKACSSDIEGEWIFMSAAGRARVCITLCNASLQYSRLLVRRKLQILTFAFIPTRRGLRSARFAVSVVRRSCFGAAATILGCAATGTVLAADNYPSKPVRLVIPFAPGGSTDLVGRMIAEYVGRELGQTVVVENKGGAGGALGAEYIARAEPDGYTIGMATVSTHGSNPAIHTNLKYDPIKDFAPVSNVMGIPSVFAVHPSVPAKDMKEFIALAKAAPEKYSFASPGVASLGHANIENFMMLSGIRLLHVPYRGAGPALNDALAGQVNAITDNLSSTLPNLQSGRLRPLALLAARLPPAVPYLTA